MTEFSVFMPLQAIAPWICWLGGISLKDYKIIWKIKMGEMKKKIKYLKTLIVLPIKWTGMVEIKHKYFIDAVPTIPSMS